MAEKLYLLEASTSWTSECTFQNIYYWEDTKHWLLARELIKGVDVTSTGDAIGHVGDSVNELERTSKGQSVTFYALNNWNSEEPMEAEPDSETNRERDWWLTGWFKKSASIEKEIDLLEENEKKELRQKKQYTCTVCHKQFKLFRYFHAHTEKHKEDASHQCSICNKTFARKFNLTKHQRIHDDVYPYSCTICGYACRDSSGLKRHLRKHTNETPFGCNVCGKMFKLGYSLKAHLSTHTPQYCTQCGKIFSGKSNLRNHIKTIHTSEERFTCGECGESFTWKSNLEKHTCYPVTDQGVEH